MRFGPLQVIQCTINQPTNQPTNQTENQTLDTVLTNQPKSRQKWCLPVSGTPFGGKSSSSVQACEITCGNLASASHEEGDLEQPLHVVRGCRLLLPQQGCQIPEDNLPAGDAPQSPPPYTPIFLPRQPQLAGLIHNCRHLPREPLDLSV